MLELIRQYRANLGVVLLVLAYIVSNMIFTFKGIYFLNVLPVVVFIVYLAFVRLDILYFIIIASTPLSIPLIEFYRSSPIDFYIPTEPLLFGVMIIVIFKLAKKNFIDRRIISHPVSLAILFNLLWLLFTSITSTMPLVSFKFLLARIWFLTTFYLVAIYIFRDPRNIPKLVWAYTIPLLVVIAYAINRHLAWGLFDKQAAHTVMNPFYRDHTSYGAILAMVLFAYAGVNLKKGQSFLRKTAIWSVFTILFIALILSYTRAAWISVICGLMIIGFTMAKIKFKYLAIAGIVILGVLFNNRYSIVHKLEKNKQDSSTNIAEHFQSVTNIATDESNLERLNRWAAAIRMFKERPVFGFGPGTYMFNYAPYQLSYQKTNISTNFGDLGNAHSEYIGPLAEAGILGSLSFILIAVVSIYIGYKVYNRIKERQLRIVLLTSMVALITYLIHGFLNNFLDTDKASSLFWGFIAIIVSLDIYYKPGKKRNLLQSQEDQNKKETVK
ncbi:MAG: O-antigen ligase family protein [Bacteroidales bacterium]|nr:O-antigen ligase family protein [Bacteroidales bacterium]MBN2821218.1 O-antigen ligase family protein [Bacteroidales bacterium]